LPCRHSICASCARTSGSYDRDGDSRVIWISTCVLHQAVRDFSPPYTIHLKPKSAGYRVLTLDKGGVRGIIKLKILGAIEQRLGGKIPIQRFFDLIRGTSTGALVAIGLGIKNWRVEEFLSRFKSLCLTAFIPDNRSLTLLFRGCTYASFQLENALKQAFGGTGKIKTINARVSDCLIAKLGHLSRFILMHYIQLEGAGPTVVPNKVFATGTIDGGDKGTLIPNYLRPRDAGKMPFLSHFFSNVLSGTVSKDLLWNSGEIRH
jgi:hypothetical protein